MALTSRVWRATGPLGLVMIWVLAVLAGWQAAGPLGGLIGWLLLAGIAGLTLAVIVGAAGAIGLRLVQARHRRFDHAGAADVVQLARIARRAFLVGHLGLAGVVLTGAALACLALKGLPVTAFLLAFAVIPAVCLIWRCIHLTRGPHAAAGLLIHPPGTTTRQGRQALDFLSHPHRLSQVLAAAYASGDAGLPAREVLAVLQHPAAFWPKLTGVYRGAGLGGMRWRIAALRGLAWHAVSAGIVAWVLALTAPAPFLRPLPSPLTLWQGAQDGPAPQAAATQGSDAVTAAFGAAPTDAAGQGPGPAAAPTAPPADGANDSTETGRPTNDPPEPSSAASAADPRGAVSGDPGDPSGHDEAPFQAPRGPQTGQDPASNPPPLPPEVADPQAVTSGAVAAGDADAAPAPLGPDGWSDPLAASGQSPAGLTIRQRDLPSYAADLPPPPAVQTLPAWVLELERASD